MDIQQLKEADILDILFEGRNKDYGAYQLRKTYNGRLFKALSVTGSVCLLLIFGYTLAGKPGRSSINLPYTIDSISLVDPHQPKPEQPIQIPKPQPIQYATIQSSIPRIVPNDQVRPEDVPPTVDQQDDVRISDHTQTGAPGDDDAPPINNSNNGTGVTEKPPVHDAADDETIHLTVGIESSYPGGIAAWQRFLLKTWRSPDNGDETIGGQVVVQFVVDKEGNVSDIKAISGPPELQKEAVRVIGKSGKWTPAIQNGRKVNSYKRQPITVELRNE